MFLGALARIDYSRTKADEKQDCRLLLSWYGTLPGHITRTDLAMDLYTRQAGKLLAPPRGLDGIAQVGLMEERCTVSLRDYIPPMMHTR